MAVSRAVSAESKSQVFSPAEAIPTEVSKSADLAGTYAALYQASVNHPLFKELKQCVTEASSAETPLTTEKLKPFLDELKKLENFSAGTKIGASYGEPTLEAWGAGLNFMETYWSNPDNQKLAVEWHNEKNDYIQKTFKKNDATSPGCLSFIAAEIGSGAAIKKICFVASSRPGGFFLQKEEENAEDKVVIASLKRNAGICSARRVEQKEESKEESKTATVETKITAIPRAAEETKKPQPKKNKQKPKSTSKNPKPERKPIRDQYLYEVTPKCNPQFNLLIGKLLEELKLPAAEHPDRFCAEKFFMRTVLQLIHEYPDFKLDGIVNFSFYPYEKNKRYGEDKPGKPKSENPKVTNLHGDKKDQEEVGSFVINAIPCCRNCKANYFPMVSLALLLDREKRDKIAKEYHLILEKMPKEEGGVTVKMKEKALKLAKKLYRENIKKESMFDTPIGTPIKEHLRTPAGTPAQTVKAVFTPSAGLTADLRASPARHAASTRLSYSSPQGAGAVGKAATPIYRGGLSRMFPALPGRAADLTPEELAKLAPESPAASVLSQQSGEAAPVDTSAFSFGMSQNARDASYSATMYGGDASSKLSLSAQSLADPSVTARVRRKLF